MTFTNYHPVTGTDRDSNLGQVDRNKGAAGFTSLKALSLDRFAVPTIEAKNAICLGNRIPALDEGQLLA